MKIPKSFQLLGKDVTQPFSRCTDREKVVVHCRSPLTRTFFGKSNQAKEWGKAGGESDTRRLKIAAVTWRAGRRSSEGPVG